MGAMGHSVPCQSMATRTSIPIQAPSETAAHKAFLLHQGLPQAPG